MFFNRKTAQELTAKAKQEGFAKAEAIMQDAMDKARAVARGRESDLIRKHQEELSKLRKDVEKTLGVRIGETKGTFPLNLLKCCL